MTYTLKQIFAEPWIENEYMIRSTYIAALKDARIITNRDLSTGEKIANQKHGSWSGALIYLTIIETLSNIIDTKINVKSKQSGHNFIKFSIEYLNLKYEDACTLYALRCSFAHNFGLVNKINNKGHKDLERKFIVTQGTQKLIEYKADTQKHIVDLEKLGDILEEFHNAMKTEVITAQTKKNIQIEEVFIKNKI